MTNSQNVKIVIFVPKSHTSIIKEAIGQSKAGRIGNYSHCTFSTEGVGSFKPLKGANPTIGEVDKIEEVIEERVEFICPRELAKEVVNKLKEVHPYEEVAYDVYPLEDF